MERLAIKWPKGGSHRIRFVPFVAAGRAPATFIGVHGYCRAVADPNTVIRGTLLSYFLDKGRGNHDRYRWSIVFPRPFVDGEYELTVVGMTADGDTESATKRFAVNQEFEFITVASHTEDQDITGEAEDFVAYGEITERPLGVAKLVDRSDQTEILPLHTFSDHESLNFWSAQFPSLAPGSYDLLVADSTGGSSSRVDNLTVSP